MRKKSWLFLLYIVAIAAVLIAVLVFYDENKDKEENPNPPDIVEDEGDTEEDITIYATSLTLHLPSTINILKDKEVHLKDDYISVVPSSMLSEIRCDVVPRYNSDPFGIEFNNSTIKANVVGSYILRFRVLKAENSYITREVTVYVYEDESNAHISQINDELIIGNNEQLTDLFNVTSQLSYYVLTDNKIEYNNSTLTPLAVGTSNIHFVFADYNVEYLYDFSIDIKAEPIYKIVTTGINNTIEINMAEDDVFWLQYEIVNTKGDPANQKVSADVGNNSIITANTDTDQLIKITALNKGETTLTIICSSDPSVKTTITIIIK